MKTIVKRKKEPLGLSLSIKEWMEKKGYVPKYTHIVDFKFPFIHGAVIINEKDSQ